jgi:hypothetical protein
MIGRYWQWILENQNISIIYPPIKRSAVTRRTNCYFFLVVLYLCITGEKHECNYGSD